METCCPLPRKLDASNLIELESGSSDLLSKYLSCDFFLLPVPESKESLKNKISYVVWRDNVEQLLLRLSVLINYILISEFLGKMCYSTAFSSVIEQSFLCFSSTGRCQDYSESHCLLHFVSCHLWEKEQTKCSVGLALLVNSLIIFFSPTKQGNKLKFHINLEPEKTLEKSGFPVCRSHEPCIYYYSVKSPSSVTVNDLVILITISL